MSRLQHNYKTWVEVNKKALLGNAKIVRGLLKPGVKLMAVVKSNAYGHGLVETVKVMVNFQGSTLDETTLDENQYIDWLGVDNIDEAILLRRDGIKSPILVLGYTQPERFVEAVKNNLRLTIYDLEIPKYISKNYKPSAISYKLHLKIDTGMSRQGVMLTDLPEFIKKMPSGLNIEGVFTHLANADNLQDRSYSDLQLANFKKALQMLDEHNIKPALRHAIATTGILTIPEAQYDMVRIGLALYGLWPSSEFAKEFENLGLRPVLSWKTRIVQIKKIKKDTPVGYGITEVVKKDSTVAVLPIGYYDGYDRGLSSIGEVLIGDRRCKILGRISMNLTVVDISYVKNVKIWDEVMLIGGVRGGELITAEELADKLGVSYEVVARINPLLPRIYT